MNIWTRTRNTLLLKAAKIHSIQQSLELSRNKFMIRFRTHQYTKQFVTNIITAYGTDTNTNSNINGFQDCDNELTRLTLNCKLIETEKKLEFQDTKQSKILNKMLVHFEKNKNTILEMIRAF